MIMKKVAFQGERGAYSEEAIVKYLKNADSIAYPTMREVFEAVNKGDVDFAMIPIENSIEGSVGEAIDLLMRYPLKINAEIILRIVHCLISNPDTSLSDIKTVYSHPQALGQCRNFLEKLNCKIVPVHDTAGSVKMIKILRMQLQLQAKEQHIFTE